MRGKILALAIILLMVAGSFGAAANKQTKITKSLKEYVPGEVVVGFYKTMNVKDINSFKGQHIKNKIETLNVAVVEVKEGTEQAFIDSVASSPVVKYAEFNLIINAYLTPNDPMWSQQWGPQRIHCAEAWDSGTGSSSVKIAIVDTGIDYNHEDITANYVTGGHDWINGDNDPMDDNNHGTHCAGIAAAVMNNAKGIAGVAQVKLMAEKVLNSGGQGTSDSVANGITHAADNGANVISMSLGSSGSSSVIEDACNYAYNTKGVVLVAASGNDGQPQVSYPAGYDSVIAVGAINQNDQRCDFSNYGDKLELMAPGYQVLSTVRNNGYDSYDGTSMACPHVAGVAALAISKNPGQNNAWIREKLDDSAEDLGDAGKDIYYGYGLVDARLSDTSNLIEVDKDANEFYQKDDRWHTWSDHGMECDNYWWAGTDYIYYNFDIPQNTPGPVLIGAEFKADILGGNDGPDLDAYNPASGTWIKIKQGMGNPSVLTWKWYTISKDYISSSGELKFRMLCAWGCHAWLDTVGVKYAPLPPPPEEPDLKCTGTLSWTNVQPGSTVTGSFTVKNIGDPGSKLNWQVAEWPSWGTWTFVPQSGSDLKPEDGAITVQLSVVVPDQQYYEFNGHIKIVNIDNDADYEIIPVSLTTPLNQPGIQQSQSSPSDQQINQMPNNLLLRHQMTK